MLAFEKHGQVGVAVCAVRSARPAAEENGPCHVVSVRNPMKEAADGFFSVLVNMA